MVNKETNKLNRKELLEIIIKQEKENAALRERLAKCEQELARRQIDIQESGTMAEAALKLNKVFEAADLAARQYLENLRLREEPASLDTSLDGVPEPLSAEDGFETQPRSRQMGRFLKRT